MFVGWCCSNSRAKNRSKFLSRSNARHRKPTLSSAGLCLQSEHPAWGRYRFKLLSQLGEGSTGKVCSGQCLQTGEVVAIKLIHHPTSLRDVEQSLVELATQAHMAARSPFIVELKEVVITSSHRIGAVMELLDGGDMQCFIQQRMIAKEGAQLLLEEEKASFIFRQLASAIRTCHNNNVAHRDVKPANVLLSSSNPPVLKLADFSCARGWGANSTSITFGWAGTTAYMAPELLTRRQAGHANVGYDMKKSDIWSLGVWLVVLMLGRLPFSGTSWPAGEDSSIEQLQERYRDGGDWRKAKLLRSACSKLSPGLVELLDALLQLDPCKRPNIQTVHSHPWVQQQLKGKLAQAWEHLEALQNTKEQHAQQLHSSLQQRTWRQQLAQHQCAACVCGQDATPPPKQCYTDMVKLLCMSWNRPKFKHLELAAHKKYLARQPHLLLVAAHVPSHKLPHLDCISWEDYSSSLTKSQGIPAASPKKASSGGCASPGNTEDNVQQINSQETNVQESNAQQTLAQKMDIRHMCNSQQRNDQHINILDLIDQEIHVNKTDVQQVNVQQDLQQHAHAQASERACSAREQDELLQPLLAC